MGCSVCFDIASCFLLHSTCYSLLQPHSALMLCTGARDRCSISWLSRSLEIQIWPDLDLVPKHLPDAAVRQLAMQNDITTHFGSNYKSEL